MLKCESCRDISSAHWEKGAFVFVFWSVSGIPDSRDARQLAADTLAAHPLCTDVTQGSHDELGIYRVTAYYADSFTRADIPRLKDEVAEALQLFFRYALVREEVEAYSESYWEENL